MRYNISMKGNQTKISEVIQTGWHATRNKTAILTDGVVKPTRLPCICLFSTEDSARSYADEFGYGEIVRVQYSGTDVANVWKPEYPKGGSVIRLKPGCIALLDRRP
jgi:hypothetical protein